MGVLVLLSLMLITVYFRESPTGVLHSAQSVGATALRPFEVGVERVSRPFRDLYGWFAALIHAKSENERLRQELSIYKQRFIANESALQESVYLRQQLGYQDTAQYPEGFRPVATRVIAHPPNRFEQQIVVAAGATSGIKVSDPVVTGDGLVGEVTKVTRDTALVTLITDPDSAVAAVDLTSRARGVIRKGQGSGDTLVLDRVDKRKVVRENDLVITAGTLAPRLRSLYPKGIGIGVVTSVGQTNTDTYKQIQVAPFVDFSELETVAVLVSNRPRPELP